MLLGSLIVVAVAAAADLRLSAHPLRCRSNGASCWCR
jgi:hypothetical protein